MLTLLLPLAALLAKVVTADTFIVPEHTRYTLSVEISQSSIISDAQLAGELDWLVFGTNRSIPSSVYLKSIDCPSAVVDDSEKGYKWVSGFPAR